jgi:hypothetical protein
MVKNMRWFTLNADSTPELISMEKRDFWLNEGVLGLVLILIGFDILVELLVLGCARKRLV